VKPVPSTAKLTVVGEVKASSWKGTPRPTGSWPSVCSITVRSRAVSKSGSTTFAAGSTFRITVSCGVPSAYQKPEPSGSQPGVTVPPSTSDAKSR